MGQQARCCNCRQTMRVLDLAGHYKRRVEIDVCSNCRLMWFENTEAAQLAGPAQIDLVHLIHEGLQGQNDTQLQARLQCAYCESVLKQVQSPARFGVSRQLQCPQGHGYAQTFLFYLAEKGFLRPLAWADIKPVAGQHLFCAGCGAPVEAKPHSACPYCASNLGVLDPARLASALDIQEAALDQIDLLLTAEIEQARCWSCGGTVDPAKDRSCPHCQVVLTHKGSAGAVAAARAVEARVRANYEQQLPEVSAAKTRESVAVLVMYDEKMDRFNRKWNFSREQITKFIALLAVIAIAIAWLPRLMDVQKSAKQAAAAKVAANSATPTPTPATAPSAKEMAASANAAPAGEAGSASAAAAVPASATGAKEDEVSIAQMFSKPAMECEPDAAQRQAVKISLISIVPGRGASAKDASMEEMRAAYRKAEKLRQEARVWNFGQLRQEHHDLRGSGEEWEKVLLRKGKLPRELEQAAFCLPSGSISPVLHTASGFHLLHLINVQ